MGATVSWKPVNPGKIVQTRTPEALSDALYRAFYGHPIRLSDKDQEVLRGMAAVWGDRDGEDRNPFDVLADAIVEYGEIEVIVER